MCTHIKNDYICVCVCVCLCLKRMGMYINKYTHARAYMFTSLSLFLYLSIYIDQDSLGSPNILTSFQRKLVRMWLVCKQQIVSFVTSVLIKLEHPNGQKLLPNTIVFDVNTPINNYLEYLWTTVGMDRSRFVAT